MSIPVHSTVLLTSREEGRRFPKGDLKLAFCPACGFIQNFVYDPSLLDYSGECEESQAFSSHFTAFLRGQVEHLVDRYDIRGKTVLEIGCGKGDFLELICEVGDNRGIGIDPGHPREGAESGAAEGGPPPEPEPSRTEYIREFYDARFASLSADLICCRHTLEHIAPVKPFVDLLRRSIGAARDTIVFFEVPDVERVLREAAFWDIYYEHCSYFTLSSLARLFRSSGFDILELEKGYDDQYLLIVARPAVSPAGPPSDARDIDDLARAVRSFEQRVGEVRAHWKHFVTQRRSAGKRIAVWGSSSKGVAFLTTLGVHDAIDVVVDINPYKQGRFMPGSGHEIVSPEALVERAPDCVIAMNPVYLEEIRADLEGLGLNPELVAL
jgi:SAM-dependent methyltransferase